MDISDFGKSFAPVEIDDLRFAALEYAIGIVVSELQRPQPLWNERVPGLCEAAAVDFGSRMRRAGTLVDPEHEELLAGFMQAFLTMR